MSGRFFENDFVEYYLCFRPQIFTGFLTIGSFLLSMKTFIITTMKKEYYLTEEYKTIHLTEKAIGLDHKTTRSIGRS